MGYKSKDFAPLPSKEENTAAMDKWLNRAVEMEKGGKSEKMIELCLNKAEDYQNAALVT
jgi:hypothetical protein